MVALRDTPIEDYILKGYDNGPTTYTLINVDLLIRAGIQQYPVCP